MRKTDDLIISTINTVVPTDSFHPDAVAACKNLHENLGEGNLKRQKLIQNCLSITTDQVKKLKEERQMNLNDVKVSKNLRAEQTKVCMFLFLGNFFQWILISAEDAASRT